MPSARHILALLAAIMFVIGGAPARAAPTPCDPCPPDCPMMAQMHMGSAAVEHAHPAPADGKAANPCKHGLACQAAASAPPLPQASFPLIRMGGDADLRALDREGGPSRPPDPTLRPPRQL